MADFLPYSSSSNSDDVFYSLPSPLLTPSHSSSSLLSTLTSPASPPLRLSPPPPPIPSSLSLSIDTGIPPPPIPSHPGRCHPVVQICDILRRLYQSIYADMVLVMIMLVISAAHVFAACLLSSGGVRIGQLGTKHIFHPGESNHDVVIVAGWGLLSALSQASFIVYSNRQIYNWGWKQYLQLMGYVIVVVVRGFILYDASKSCQSKHHCQRSKVLATIDLSIIPMVISDIAVYTIGRLSERMSERRERRRGALFKRRPPRRPVV